MGIFFLRFFQLKRFDNHSFIGVLSVQLFSKIFIA